ncbi:serine/threonine-protein kinase [Pseudooceanicola sp. 502str34]
MAISGHEEPIVLKDPLATDIFSTGQVLNNTYEILGVLGRGGTGEVYLATNQISERRVAIKALNARFSGQSEYIELMKREEQMRSILNDAVVRYSDCSRSDDGHVFLVMDYVDGTSLHDVMRERRLEDRELLIIAHRVLEGLRATHAQGIVHRDLSPDNIILRGGRAEEATIIDFGIAKDTAAGARTIVGKQFAGKYEYAAPEQLDGEADYPADLYALGASLLAAWHREVPDVGTNPGEVVRFKAKPLDTSGVGAPLKDLIDWLTAPAPAQRPQTATEALERLDHWLKPFTSAAPAKSRGRRRGLLAVAAVVLLAAAGGGLWQSGALDALFPPPPPHAAPYRMTARHGDGPPTLTGHVPDDPAAERLRAAYATATGDSAPATGLTLATGLPFDDWPTEIAALIERLAPLQRWDLEVTDGAAQLTGLAPSRASRDALQKALSAREGGLSLSADLVAGPEKLAASALETVLAGHSDCGPLQQLDGPDVTYALFDTITITGDISDEIVAEGIRADLSSSIGDRTLRMETRVLNADLCAIRAVMPNTPPGPVSIWLGNGATGQPVLTGVYRTGENPVAEIQLPADMTGASLWVMVVDTTGKVFHILPNINAPETAVDQLGIVEDGIRRIRVLWPISALAEDPTRLAMQVTDGDYGASEIVAIVSREPLFDLRRPRDESVASVAEALTETLDGRADVVIGIASRIIDARP